MLMCYKGTLQETYGDIVALTLPLFLLRHTSLLPGLTGNAVLLHFRILHTTVPQAVR